MDDLMTWLLVQLDEDEARTRKMLAYAQQTVLTLQDPRHLGKFIPGWHDWPDVERMCTERLAEIDAKRRILDLHAPVATGPTWQPGPPQCEHCAGLCHSWSGTGCEGPDAPYPCPTVRLLAVPMAGRDGYRSEWRP